jgi:hypothetical protein
MMQTKMRERLGNRHACCNSYRETRDDSALFAAALMLNLKRLRTRCRRFKVYVGETNNMARRHGWEYRAHGDHLAPFFEAALNNGSTVWRRVRYTVSRSLPPRDRSEA